MSPRNVLLALLAFVVPAVSVALAQDPAALPDGAFDPTVVQAKEEGVVVRAQPGFLFKELDTLSRGEQVTVDRREGDWLRLQAGGWVAVEDVADATRSLADGLPAVQLRVTSDGARLRGGAGTQHDIVGKKQKGDLVTGYERAGDWWRIGEKAWIFVRLVEEVGEPPARAAAEAPPASEGAADPPSLASPAGIPVRRWSYMDLNGTLFEIFEVDRRATFIAGLKKAMRDTGVLEDDWAYLRLVISVPEGRLSFTYSPRPDGNPVSVVNQAGKRFGSVYVQGPVERIPMHLRGFFEGQTIAGGQRFEGLLMFRPTLDAQEIEKVQMLISGRARTFFESK